MPLEEADLKDETELENILKKDPEQIEKGLRVVANQVATPKGRIDLLCIDAERVISIIEIKLASDENQLTQAIKYYDWAIENIDWIKDAYGIKAADQKPRIILVASDFDEDLLLLAKYWNEYISPVTPYRYKCVNAENRKYIVCSEVILQSPKDIQEKPKTIEDHLNYIRDEKVRKNCIEALETIKKISDKKIEVAATKYSIVFRFKGRNFATITPRRESFVLKWKSEEEEEWPRKTGLKKMDQINEVIDNNIKRAFFLVGGKN